MSKKYFTGYIFEEEIQTAYDNHYIDEATYKELKFTFYYWRSVRKNPDYFKDLDLTDPEYNCLENNFKNLIFKINSYVDIKQIVDWTIADWEARSRPKDYNWLVSFFEIPFRKGSTFREMRPKLRKAITVLSNYAYGSSKANENLNNFTKEKFVKLAKDCMQKLAKENGSTITTPKGNPQLESAASKMIGFNANQFALTQFDQNLVSIKNYAPINPNGYNEYYGEFIMTNGQKIFLPVERPLYKFLDPNIGSTIESDKTIQENLKNFVKTHIPNCSGSIKISELISLYSLLNNNYFKTKCQEIGITDFNNIRLIDRSGSENLSNTCYNKCFLVEASIYCNKLLVVYYNTKPYFNQSINGWSNKTGYKLV